MRMLYWIQIGLLLLLCLPIRAISESGQTLGAMKNGLITAVSLEENTIKIDQISFKLADNLTVVSDETIISKVLLTPGMQVSYWTGSSKEGSDIVSKIKITSKFDKNAYPR